MKRGERKFNLPTQIRVEAAAAECGSFTRLENSMGLKKSGVEPAAFTSP